MPQMRGMYQGDRLPVKEAISRVRLPPDSEGSKRTDLTGTSVYRASLVPP